MPEPHKAVFLDRDGTVIVDTVFSVDPARIEALPGSLEGLRALQEAGYRLVLITNQSGVARGYFTEEGLAAFHTHLSAWFAERGIRIAGIYHCPHYPNGSVPEYTCECRCRKPFPGMLLQAAREQNIDLARSWMVGDRDCDVAAGKVAGCRTVRIGTTAPGETAPDFETTRVDLAAGFILARDRTARA